jgi:hypothetical protein
MTMIQGLRTAIYTVADLDGAQGVQDVGGGIRTASVIDPFGNVFGIIENPHFKLP